MTRRTVDIFDARTSPDVIPEAARQIEDEGVVLLPTETVFALAARAESDRALDRLWRAKGDESRSPLALHLGSVEEALALLDADWPVHRRLMLRLLPGPATFKIVWNEDRAREVRSRLGVAPGVVDDGEGLLIRVPAHPLALRIIGEAEPPLVMASVAGSEQQQPRRMTDAVELLEVRGVLDEISMVVDGEPAPLVRRSTLIRLSPDGSYRVDREGAYESRYVRDQLRRTIIFVCTGNTCRSPMAAAIARHELQRMAQDGIETVIRSAGVFAGSGAPATSEGVVALENLGIAPGTHRSSPLTREMISQADLIFTMTRAHVDGVLSIDPTASDRVLLLDPEGGDVPDPIGGSQQVYDDTARRIQLLVRHRLQDLFHRQEHES